MQNPIKKGSKRPAWGANFVGEMMQPAIWRLVKTAPAPGAWNMAVDEAILESVGQRLVLPTLRLFAWDPPCLSLGFSQPVQDVDRAALEQYGWQLVRRPTGGRAILHTDELTYSVIAPLDEPRVAGSVLESYSRLSQALLNALGRLGLPAQADKEYNLPLGAQPSGPVCFEVPSNYEITAGGKKLIGSAQARRKEGVLQHGSLPMYGDLTRITQALRYPSENDRAVAAERLLAHATNLEMLGTAANWDTCAQAFTSAFREVLNITFQEEALTPLELQRADALTVGKYANAAWTEKL